MKKALVIINPVSGKKKSRTALFDITESLCKNNYEVCVKTTLRQGHGIEIAEKYAKKFDLIVCCGGDGTVNEVVSGVVKSGTDTVIGYIPAGSTNDFASSLKLETNTKKAIDNMLSKPVSKLDVGMFNDSRYFNYIASFGLFSAVSYKVPQNTKNSLGYFAYVLEALKDLSSIKPCHVKITSKEKTTEGDYIFGTVANSTSVGGIMHFKSDEVDMNDGLFEIMLVKNPTDPAQLSKIIFSMNASDFSGEMFEYFHTDKVSFEFEEPIPWSLDGEYQEGSLKVEIENLHSAITFAGLNNKNGLE